MTTILPVLAARIGTALFQLFCIAALIFSIMYLMPGDPVMLLLGQDSNPSPEAVAAMRAQLGLDQPVPTQFLHWITGAIQGDFGQSIRTRAPVSEYIAESLPRTLELAFAAILVAILVGVPLGVIAALRRGTWIDTVATSFATLGISVPVYILGAMAVLLFALHLDWLPSSGYTDISRSFERHFLRLILPATTLGLGLAASIARMTRSSMLEILNRDFVRALRAKGLTERQVIWGHVLRNAAIPILTIIGLQLGTLMGGTVLVEAMFNWPGLSTLVVDAVSNRDYPLAQGAILAISAAYILINLVVELLYSALDPRIRRSA